MMTSRSHAANLIFLAAAMTLVAPALVPEEERPRGGRTGCDVILSDDDVTGLESCLDDVGRPFVANYIKSQRRRRKEAYDVCGRFGNLSSCIRPYLGWLRCTTDTDNEREAPLASAARRFAVSRRLRDWSHLVHQLDTSCDDSSPPDAASRLECVDSELRGPLAQRCAELFRFNVAQRTRHECHFLRERLHCEEALVTSACGDAAGNFAFTMLKLHTERISSRHGCDITRDTSYHAFRYGAGCDENLLHQLETCTKRHLVERKVVKFHASNDLVALGRDRALRHACRAFLRYQDCIQPISARCDHGLQQILDYETSLRRYTLKMNYICSEPVLDVYAEHLNCYQESARSQCNAYWADVTPWLTNISAYQFYCEPGSPRTQRLKTEMDRLRGCQGSVLKRNCGTSAATVLNDLFDIALRDPHYLRFGYRPDCRLHGAESASSPSQPPGAESARTSMDGRSESDDATSVAVPPASGDLRQPQVSRSTAPRHQTASFELAVVASYLTVAAVHLR